MMKLLFKIFLYTALVFGGLFVAGLVIMSAFGGNSESWRKQVQEIASSVSGKKVTIGKMNDARIFPHLMFDGEYIFAVGMPASAGVVQGGDVDLSQIGGGGNVAIKKLQFSVPFWTIFWGFPALQSFHMEGALVIGQKDKVLESVSLDWQDPNHPKARFQGTYNAVAYEGDLELEKGWGGARLYNEMPFRLRFNDVAMTGEFPMLVEGMLLFNEMSISVAGREYFGRAAFSDGTQYEIEVLASPEREEVLLIATPPSDLDPSTLAAVEDMQQGDAAQFVSLFCMLYGTEYVSVKLQGDAPESMACPMVNEDEEEVVPEEAAPQQHDE